MKKPFCDLSPKEVNDRLLDRFGISLFRFAQAFAVSPLDEALQKHKYPFSLKEIRAAHRSMVKVWDDIMEDARHFSNFIDKLKGLPSHDFSMEEFIKKKGIRDFRIKYFFPRLWIILFFELDRGARQGIGLNKKSIIALGWCNQIANNGCKIDWRLLGDLYEWLWQKVAPYEYYKEWEPGPGIEDYLKNQFHRYRWVGDTDKYLGDLDPFTEDKLVEFVFQLLLYRWWDFKDKYPIDKLPITNKELPRFIRNFIINFFLGRSEGASIFSKSGSLADPNFSYLYFSLRKIAASDRLPSAAGIIPPILQVLANINEMPYEGSELGDYIHYAATLYIDKKADLKNLPPMIIFPDRSYFSTAF